MQAGECRATNDCDFARGQIANYAPYREGGKRKFAAGAVSIEVGFEADT